jgi:hypothetical protein
MDDDTPHRPAPLSDHEMLAFVDNALHTNIGMAIQGAWLEHLALTHSWDVDREVLLQARMEAPDGGLAAAQAALDDMTVEERVELLDRAQHLFRTACAEAVLQLNRLAVGIGEDPRQIDGELVATVAGPRRASAWAIIASTAAR